MLWDFACPDALKDDHPEPGKAFLQMADAVIRELGLTQESQEVWVDHDDGHAGGYPQFHCLPQAQRWKPDGCR